MIGKRRGLFFFSSKNHGGSERTASDGWLALALCAAALIYTGFYFDRGLDLFDAGLFAAEAERAAGGGVYGKDFLAPYGPGRYYLIGLLFKIFGPSLKVQAEFWLALRGLIAALVFFVGRRFLPKGLAMLPVLVLIAAPGALHKGLFQTAALLNVFFYLRYRRRPSLQTLSLAGLAVGAGALFRVDVGVFGFVSFLFLLCLEPLWERPRPLLCLILKRSACFTAGAALITLPVLFYLLFASDLDLILKAEWHRTLNVSAFADTLHLPSIREALKTPFPWDSKFILLRLMLYAAPCIYGLLLILVLMRRVRGDLRAGSLDALSLAVFGLPILNQVRITPTFNHWLHAVPLVLVSAVLVIHYLGKTRPFEKIPGKILRKVMFTALLVFVCGVPVFYNLVFTRGVLPPSVFNRFEFTESIALPRAGLYETPERAREIEKMVRYIESSTDPGEPVFAGPFSPVFNFLAHRPPAVRFLEPFYYFRNEEMQERMVEDLKRTRPSLIILDPTTRVGQQSLRQDAPLVYAFIAQHYDPAGKPGVMRSRYQIWLRRYR